MTLDASGNLLVGGTSSNGSRLQVTGAATFSSSVTATSFTATTSAIEIQGSVNGVKTLYINRYGVASGSQHRLRAENGYFEIASANSEPIVLAGGNVGIGTSSPTQLLSVNGASTFSGNLTVGNSLAVLYNTANTETALFQRSGSYGSVIKLGRASVSNTTTIDYPADGTFAVSTQGSERMRITSGGNVGIGTTSPNATLDVRTASNSLSFKSQSNSISFRP